MSLNLMKSISIAVFVALNVFLTTTKTSDVFSVNGLRMQHDAAAQNKEAEENEYQKGLKSEFMRFLVPQAFEHMKELINVSKDDTDLIKGAASEATKYWTEKCVGSRGALLAKWVETAADKTFDIKTNKLVAAFNIWAGVETKFGESIKSSLVTLRNKQKEQGVNSAARKSRVPTKGRKSTTKSRKAGSNLRTPRKAAIKSKVSRASRVIVAPEEKENVSPVAAPRPFSTYIQEMQKEVQKKKEQIAEAKAKKADAEFIKAVEDMLEADENTINPDDVLSLKQKLRKAVLAMGA